MKLHRSHVLLSCVLAFGASASHAEGFYAGTGIQLRHYDLTQPGTTQDGSPSGHVLSGKLFAGYDFDDTWAIEGGYVNFGKPSYSYSFNGTSGQISASSRAAFVAAKASRPLSEKFGLFAKLGLDRHCLEVTGSGVASPLARSKSTTALYLGAGMQYKINKNLASTLELEHFGRDAAPGSSLTSVSLNLKYSF